MPSPFEDELDESHATPSENSATRHPPHSQKASDFICDECKAVDWPRLPTLAADMFRESASRPPRPRVLRPLNATSAELRCSPCKICSLLGTIKPADFDGRDCELQAMAASNELLFYRRAIDGFSQAILLKVFVESSFTDSDRCLAVLDSRPDAAPYDIGPRRISPGSIDYNLLKNLIGFCSHNHKTCSKASRSNLPGFKVINVKTREVIEAEPSCTYLALSYVWGTFESTESSTSYDLDLAPPVIQDAILVTGSLGYEYLWVDKYCIPQSNLEEKHLMISQMDQIYSNASATIIAAAGEDAQVGLPGVSRIPRQHQREVDVLGVTLLQMPHGGGALSSSRWASRGWTYQEGYLSKRRLIFTDSQVLYLCNEMYSEESFKQPLSPELSYKGRSSFSRLVPEHRLQQDSIRTFLSQIEEYSRRDLSCSGDSLNAFLGIFNYQASISPPILHLWGLPIQTPATDLADMAFYPLWWHASPVTRRPEFPSWTWAGWAGPVRFSLRRYNISSITQKQAVCATTQEEDPAGPHAREPQSFRVFVEDDDDHNHHQEHRRLGLYEYAQSLLRATQSQVPKLHYDPGPRRLLISCPVLPLRLQLFSQLLVSDPAQQRPEKTTTLLLQARPRREPHARQCTRSFDGPGLGLLAVAPICPGVYVGLQPCYDQPVAVASREDEGRLLALYMRRRDDDGGEPDINHHFLIVRRLRGRSSGGGGEGRYERVGAMEWNSWDTRAPQIYMNDEGTVLDVVHLPEAKDVFTSIAETRTVCLV